MTIAMKQQKFTLLKFGAFFTFFCAAFYSATVLIPSAFATLNNHTATTLGFLLQVLGMHPAVQGAMVSVADFSVKIIGECSALYVFILFSSFVLAYPTTLQNKAVGLLFGIPALFAVNTLRLVIVFLVGLWRPDIFEYVHVYLWQPIIIILIFISCLVWLRYVVMITTRNEPLTFLVRFIAFSSIPFLIWFHLDKIYVSITGHVTEFLLNCMGYHIQLEPNPDILFYPATFNLIVFSALILATQSASFSRKGVKTKALVIGISLMALVEVIHEVFQVLAYFGMQHALEMMYATRISNQYFLPFGLWLAFTYADLFKRAGTYTCPICGEEKVGIVEHIKAKHGEKALEREDVKEVLDVQRSTFKVSKAVEKLRLPDVGILDYTKKK
ncbi:MAG: exosortase H [Euryarchaeota archaeon]|nr:exosortase H [Euryarchaeota archaeon]